MKLKPSDSVSNGGTTDIPRTDTISVVEVAELLLSQNRRQATVNREASRDEHRAQQQTNSPTDLALEHKKKF